MSADLEMILKPSDYAAQLPDADIAIVIIETALVACLVPLTERAHSLFVRWGMSEDCIGISPPESVLDLTGSVPRNWVIGLTPILVGAHIIAEVPLPQDRIVVH